MSKEKPTPEDKAKAEAAYAKFMKEILDKNVVDRFLNLQPEDLIEPDPDAEIIKGNANNPGAWGHGPAQFELNAAADRRLAKCADKGGLGGNLVHRVHVTLIKDTKMVALRPAGPNDLTALEVKRFHGQSSAWVNLITLLAPAGLTIESGYRELFYTAYIPEGSKLWPGIFIDLGRPLKRRVEPVSVAEGEGEDPDSENEDSADE